MMTEDELKARFAALEKRYEDASWPWLYYQPDVEAEGKWAFGIEVNRVTDPAFFRDIADLLEAANA